MKAKFLLLTGIFFFCLSSMAQKTKVFTLNVFFETDKSVLSDKEKAKIEALLDTLEFDRVKFVNLKGHTDSRADSLYNVKLSERRTAAVADFMKTLDVPMDKVSKGAFGENLPATENETDMGKQKNRRVEIRIVYLFPPPPAEIKKDTVKKTVPDPCEGDTVMAYSTGIKLMVDKCNYKLLKKCVKVKTIDNAIQIRDQNVRMRDNKGNYLVSDGMFELQWDSTCGQCGDFLTKWIMTEEEVKSLGYNFYSYNENGRAWTQLPRRRIKRIKIEGKDFYEVELTCNDFGTRFNKDKLVPEGLAKIKVAGRWRIVGIESDHSGQSFYYRTYEETETFDSKKKWKVLPMASDVYIISKKGTNDTLHVKFMDLSPRKVKFFRYRLIKTYGDGKIGWPHRGWPHVKTLKRTIPKPVIKESHLYYRKYKIRARTIRRLMKIKQHDRILR